MSESEVIAPFKGGFEGPNSGIGYYGAQDLGGSPKEEGEVRFCGRLIPAAAKYYLYCSKRLK